MTSPDDAGRPPGPGALRLDRLRELTDDEPGAWLGRDRIGGATFEVRALRLPEHDRGDAAVDAAIARVERIAAALADVDDSRVMRPVRAWRADDAARGEVTVASVHLPGTPLRDALRGVGGLEPSRAALVLGDVARALAAAHARGVIHADVRPEHVRLAEDGTGVARLGGFERRAVLGDAGLADSTPPAYQSPEQLDGHRPDARADVHALGLLGWELLTGRRPWSGDMAAVAGEKQRHDALPALAVLRPDVPRGLIAALERAMLKDPARRWADAGAFADAVERVRATRTMGSAAAAPTADAGAPGVTARLEDEATRAPHYPLPLVPPGARAPRGWSPSPAPGVVSHRRRTMALGALAVVVLAAASAVALRERARVDRDARWLDSLQRGVSTGELFDTAPTPPPVDSEPLVRRPRRRPVVVPPPESLPPLPTTESVPPTPAPPTPAQLAPPAPPVPADSALPPLPAEPPRARVRLPGDTARRDTTRPDTAPPDTTRPDSVRPDTPSVPTVPPPRR